MRNLSKSRNNKEIYWLRTLLRETYKKPVFYRKEKVETLKRLINRNDYHVPGKSVVNKWFP
ncbi:flagellar biosynthesis anti-sigma factor FlgM [bacterium]|nr:flagellar biosynthesis anti-sigma factor FlgM [bacterium]